MGKNSLKTKLRTTVTSLLLAVLFVWALFFAYTTNSIAEGAKQNAEAASTQIIEILDEQFLQLERISFTLSQSATVADFAAEPQLLRYHEKALDVQEILDGMQDRTSFVGNLIIFSDRNIYYRFWGNMGNTSAAKVYFSVSPTEQPRDLVITLDSIPYIGYTTGIYQNGEPVGTIVMLIEESKLQSLFSRYQNNDSLQISLAAGGKIVTSSAPVLVGRSVEEAARQAYSFSNRQVGFTPFEILVSSKGSQIWSGAGYFAMTAAITAAIFAVLLIVFTRYLNHYFFAPMLDIMRGVELLGAAGENQLPAYQEESFDRLSGKINEMLRRLDERNKALFESGLRLQSAEIVKQKAIVISLKKQISAHFTVNVLNVIKLLAGKGENIQAGEMCDGLAYLLRYANAGDEFINGLEEFFILEKYIEIMQIRYHGRFKTELVYDDVLSNIMLPRMLLQPIVENAILHGLKDNEDGHVEVRALVNKSRVEITVKDDGAGMDEYTLAALREKITLMDQQNDMPEGLEHIALPNIQRRIRLYFGEKSGLIIESTQGAGTTVTIVMNTEKDG